MIGLARGAVEDGQWLSPHLYGVRYVERPVLLSWIAAAIGKLSGGVSVGRPAYRICCFCSPAG